MKRWARITKTKKVKLSSKVAAKVQALAEEQGLSFSAQTRLILRRLLKGLKDQENEKAFCATLKKMEKSESNARAQARRKRFRILTGSSQKL